MNGKLRQIGSETSAARTLPTTLHGLEAPLAALSPGISCSGRNDPTQERQKRHVNAKSEHLCSRGCGKICSITVDAKTHRPASAKAEFKREHPCPSPRNRSRACPGYVIDHIRPLACGGLSPGNMQFQTIADAKAKEKWDAKQCP